MSTRTSSLMALAGVVIMGTSNDILAERVRSQPALALVPFQRQSRVGLDLPYIEVVHSRHLWASNSARIRRSTSSTRSASFGSALNSRPQQLHRDKMSGFSMSILSN